MCPVPVNVTATVLLASAVPFNTKVVSLVMLSVADVPLSVVIPVIEGVLGAVVSTSAFVVVGAVKVSPASLPAASLIVPLFRTSGEAESIPSLSVSPACTV